MGAGVGGVETVDVREEDEQVGLHTHGDAGGQGVVVADLNFFRGHGVVFVDDGQGVQLQQTDHGVVEVAEPVGLVHFLGSEQDLGHRMIVFPKGFVVGIHQLALAHGGGGLLGGHVGRPAGQVQLAHPHADGAGGHQDGLIPHALQIGQYTGQMLHVLQVEAPGLPGEGGCAHLDHQPARIARLFHVLHTPLPFALHHSTFHRRTKGAIKRKGRGCFQKEN